MKLISFRIREYRNIRDSLDIILDDDLTCIVGKNQSGKTNILRALHRLNPRGNESYSHSTDWPRANNEPVKPANAVCSATYSLKDIEQRVLKSIAPRHTTPTVATVCRNYDGRLTIVFPDSPDLNEHFNSVYYRMPTTVVMPALPSGVRPSFRNTAERCLTEAGRAFREGRLNILRPLWRQYENRFKILCNPKESRPSEAAFVDSCRSAVSRMISYLEKIPAVVRGVHEYIVTTMPTFVYMDEYRELSGVARLDQIQHRLRHHATLESDATLLLLFDLANLNVDELLRLGTADSDKQERLGLLVTAGDKITKSLGQAWAPNPFQMQFHMDGETFFITIGHEPNMGSIPLDEESKGFRWYLGFLLQLMYSSRNTFRNCVLLLDEPGLHLHPGAQKDLLTNFDTLAKSNPIVYTTHLPFLVDLRHPNRIRVMAQKANGATVTADLSSAQPQERLTLEAAFGIDLSQHYLVAQQNLIVEGVHDYWIIAEFSNLLRRSGEEALPIEVMITPAHSASGAVTLATFMVGQGLQVTALFDSDNEGRKQEKHLTNDWLLRYKKPQVGSTLLLGDAVGVKGDFVLEDLFDDVYYAQCVKKVYRDERLSSLGTQLSEVRGTLCERVEKICSQFDIEFKKGSVAKIIRDDLATARNVDGLSIQTLKYVRSLFATLRKRF
jgi:hypothetical protein